MRVVETILAPATRRAIFDEFLQIARSGVDVQDFDPIGKNGGTKPVVADQRGYYGGVDARRLHRLGVRLGDILKAHDENDTLGWFEAVRRVPHADLAEVETIPSLQILHVLPDAFDGVDPEDLCSPNGLRVPESIQDRDAVREYSALLLLPKLVLAAMAGLSEMVPWQDRDMDLGSAVHTIRPDADKLADGSGYGAAHLPCHTDGYWTEEASLPVWNVMLCVTNPFGEPTRFIQVADLFRVLDEHHPDYARWAESFADLRRSGESPKQFVAWVLREAVRPQFDFVMGRIGHGAKRSVQSIPLLEEHRTLPGFLFRYKSTFSTSNEDAQPVVEFVNRMVASLSDDQPGGPGLDVRLRPGQVLFGLNGACLRVAAPKHPSCAAGVGYPVSGSATIHGRRALRIVEGRVRRTLIRGNLVATPLRPNGSEPDVLEHDGWISRLLRSGYRANHLQR